LQEDAIRAEFIRTRLHPAFIGLTVLWKRNSQMKTMRWIGMLLLITSGGILDAAEEASVYNFMAERRINYAQTGASDVHLKSHETYNGCVGIYESGPTSFFSTVTLVWPDESTRIVEVETDDSNLGWWAYDEYDTLDELNAAFPIGDYSIVATKVAGGTTTVNLTIGSAEFPPAPTLANYEALQSFNAAADTTIEWNAWAEGTASDFIIITIEGWDDSVAFSNHEAILSGGDYTDGTEVSYVIPAGTLEAGATYTLTLQFLKTFGFHQTGGVPDFPTTMMAGSSESETSATIIASGRRSPFVPTNSLGGKWDDMWGWIDDTYFPWIYSYGHDVWIYVYDGDTVDMTKGYWVCYLLTDASDFGWGFAYANGGWWCITSDLVTRWLTPQDTIPRPNR
jgi:hypothetical protein